MRSAFVGPVLALALLGCAGRRAETAFQEGRRLGNVGQHAAASAQFAEAIRLEPGVAKYHYGMALSLAKRGLDDQAVLEAREALQIQPDYADASRLLTVVSERIQDRQTDNLAAQLQ